MTETAGPIAAAASSTNVGCFEMNNDELQRLDEAIAHLRKAIVLSKVQDDMTNHVGVALNILTLMSIRAVIWPRDEGTLQ